MNEAMSPLDTRLPAMLRSGKRLRGIFNGIPSPAIVEMCAFAGFDFLVIDNEHGSANHETTENMLRAARASNLPTLVRCLENALGELRAFWSDYDYPYFTVTFLPIEMAGADSELSYALNGLALHQSFAASATNNRALQFEIRLS